MTLFHPRRAVERLPVTLMEEAFGCFLLRGFPHLKFSKTDPGIFNQPGKQAFDRGLTLSTELVRKGISKNPLSPEFGHLQQAWAWTNLLQNGDLGY